jgi:hypothetical protein
MFTCDCDEFNYPPEESERIRRAIRKLTAIYDKKYKKLKEDEVARELERIKLEQKDNEELEKHNLEQKEKYHSNEFILERLKNHFIHVNLRLNKIDDLEEKIGFLEQKIHSLYKKLYSLVEFRQSPWDK